MPPLNEGDLMFMPIADPACRSPRTREIAMRQNAALLAFPEVASVVAKVGRADTSTDPSPLNMTETLVHLKPHVEWRPGMTLERLRTEMGRAVAASWRDEHLDDADHQSHRHADDGCAVRGRRQDVRRRSDSARSAGASIGRDHPHCAGCRECLSRAPDQRPVPEHHDRPRSAARYGISVAADPGDDRVCDRRDAGRDDRSTAAGDFRSACGSRSAFAQTRGDRRHARNVADRPADSIAVDARRSSPLAGPR